MEFRLSIIIIIINQNRMIQILSGDLPMNLQNRNYNLNHET